MILFKRLFKRRDKKRSKNRIAFNNLSNYSKCLDYIKAFDAVNQELNGRYYIELERSNKGIEINISSRNKVAPKRAKKCLKLENEEKDNVE